MIFFESYSAEVIGNRGENATMTKHGFDPVGDSGSGHPGGKDDNERVNVGSSEPPSALRRMTRLQECKVVAYDRRHADLIREIDAGGEIDPLAQRPHGALSQDDAEPQLEPRCLG